MVTIAQTPPQLVYRQDFEKANLRQFSCSDGKLRGFEISAKRSHSGQRSLLMSPSGADLQDCHQSWYQTLGDGVFTFVNWVIFDDSMRGQASLWFGPSLEYFDGTNFLESALRYNLVDDTVQVLTSAHAFTTVGTANPVLRGFNVGVNAGYGQAQGNEGWHKIVHTVDFKAVIHKTLQIDDQVYNVNNVALDSAANTGTSKIMRHEWHYQGSGSNCQPEVDRFTVYYDDCSVFRGTVIPDGF